jgi:hypothetical protein
MRLRYKSAEVFWAALSIQTLLRTLLSGLVILLDTEGATFPRLGQCATSDAKRVASMQMTFNEQLFENSTFVSRPRTAVRALGRACVLAPGTTAQRHNGTTAQRHNGTTADEIE